MLPWCGVGLAVPDFPGFFCLEDEHVEAVFDLCSPLFALEEELCFGWVIDEVVEVVAFADVLIGEVWRGVCPGTHA